MVDWIERSIGTLSPRWAASRAFYRTMLTETRGYDAAKRGRRDGSWAVSGSSANAEIASGASIIRGRARDFVRNNGHAAAAVRTLASYAVGTGIVPRLAAGGDEVERRKRAASDWQAFVENSDPEGQIDFYGQQNLAARTLVESGEVLMRFIPRPSSWRLHVPLQIQILEPDFLDSGKNEQINGGGVIIQGVEYDAFGRRAAYWLFDEHPGEIGMKLTRGRYQSQRVPASDVIHSFEPLRPGQARGISPFAPVATKFRDVADYDDAQLVSKRIAACFSVFVKRSAGDSTPILQNAKTESDGRRVETLSPGTVSYLANGEDVEFATPGQVGDYMEYMTAQLHTIAAGLGIPYSKMTGDLSNANFSSLRAGNNDFWAYLDQLQWHILVHQVCRPVWNRFAQLQLITGRRDPGQLYQARWSPPARQWTDPDREVKAARDEERAGLITPQDQLGRRGMDIEEAYEEMAAANALRDKYGLVFDSDARKVSTAGLTQARPEGTKIPAAGAPAED